MLRVFNVLLLLAALVGGCLAIQAGCENQRLRAEHRVLKAEVGLVSVGDPDQVHVVAIDTGDPLDFAWQIYMPARLKLHWEANFHQSRSSGTHGGGNQDAYFDLLRVRLREKSDGRHEVWFKQRGGSSLMGISSQDFELFKQGKVVIEQLGVQGSAVVERYQVGTLLQARDPSAPVTQPLINIRFGTPEAFQKEREQADSEPYER
jgi:hypothetical protein